MIKAISVFIVLFLLIGFCFFAIFMTPKGRRIHAPTKICDSPYVMLNDKCYYVSTKEKVTALSADICPNGVLNLLLSIESADEMQTISDYLMSLDIEEGSQFWTNANKLNSDDEFRWDYSTKEMAYTKWLPGEPDMSYTKNCLALIVHDNEIFMKSQKCITALNFICEYDLN